MRILSRFALLSSSLFFLLLIGNALQARGVTLFDNYTSVGFQINQGATISGIDSSIQTYLSPSASFISSQTAYLSDIYAPISWAHGTNSVSFDLKNNNNGSPGSTIENWSLNNLPTLGSSFYPQHLSSNGNTLLIGGVTYWLVATPGASDTWGAWNMVNNTTSPAFAVYGMPLQSQNTPEPGILATLMSMGMAGGGMFLRRLRKA